MLFLSLPHHVTQRGNQRKAIFFEDGDHEIYRDLLAEQTAKAEVEVWAYCLMPNHVHLILTPARADGLGRAVDETRRRHTNFINARGRWTGHLFQSRFSSVAMDEDHPMTAVRYVSLNPVRARLVAKAVDWPWSSVRAHLAGQDDGLVTVRPVLDRAPNVGEWLAGGETRTTPPCARAKARAGRCAPPRWSSSSNAFSAAPSPAAPRAANRKPWTSPSRVCCEVKGYGVEGFPEGSWSC